VTPANYSLSNKQKTEEEEDLRTEKRARESVRVRRNRLNNGGNGNRNCNCNCNCKLSYKTLPNFLTVITMANDSSFLFAGIRFDRKKFGADIARFQVSFQPLFLILFTYLQIPNGPNYETHELLSLLNIVNGCLSNEVLFWCISL
jgi:hypothetical protein